MSKKKRNRRPPFGTAPRATPMTNDPVAMADAGDELDDADAEGAVDLADDTDNAAEPVVDAALAQAAALSHAEPVETLAAAPAVGVVPSWAVQGSGDIRGVLIQIGGGRLLLPNATIAEVLSYAEPDADPSDAPWLLGRLRWRGWQLPLIAFSRLAGIGDDKPGLGSKVIVLKALGGDRRIPYFAIVTQGFPRLVTVSRTALDVDAGDAELPTAVQAFVRLNDEPALLPDLLQIEQHLREARDAA